MKKITLIITLTGLTIVNYSQKLEITNAAVSYKSMKMNPMWIISDKDGKLKHKLLEAKKEIDKAHSKYETANTLKPKEESKLFFYRGMIYLDYIITADSSELSTIEKEEKKYNEASLGSLKKCIDLDTRNIYISDVKMKIESLRSFALKKGVELFQVKKYKAAFIAFKRAVAMYETIGLQDSLSIYNAALSAERLKDYENAIKYYHKSAAIGYKTDISYQNLIANINTKNGGPSDEAFEYIVEGKKRYPNNLGLIIEEFNYYLLKGDIEKAKESLAKAVEKEPNNPLFRFNIAATFDELTAKKHKEGKHEEAAIFAKKTIEGYKKAIELKPDFADAYFNLGVFYNNESFELNSLSSDMKDQSKAEAVLVTAKAYLSNAIPYLKKSNELQPKNVNTLKLLKSIYFNLEKEEEYKEVTEKLKALGQ